MSKTVSHSWPVIAHQSLSHGDLPHLLKKKNLKLRFSESIVPGSVIFPLSGTAFLLVPLAKASETSKDTDSLTLTTELEERIDSFLKVHRKCLVLCMAPLHASTERRIFSLIQAKYIDTRLEMIPAHNTNEAIKIMLTISKALCKPNSEVLSARLEAVLQDQMESKYIAVALKHIKLSYHEIQMLQDRLGSLSRMVGASVQELHSCGLNVSAINKITAFCHTNIHSP